MNDAELEARLKNVPVPERAEAYWQDFPLQVRVNLRRRAVIAPLRRVWLPRLIWTGGFAAGIVFGLWLAQSQPVKMALQREHRFRMELAQFPTHLRVLMQDEHGLHYLVAEKE
ncbi:MAG TPA: hypothetical protein VGO57_15110 [Verrucomicrobiae bacterium]|jgi:hypothetical protein